MQLSTKDARRVMTKLGVELVECKHHIRGFVLMNGRRLFPIHCSNGHKDMPKGVAHMFRKSLKLSMEEFARLCGCTLGFAEYVSILRQKGEIPG
jgi:hypothetical protein